MKREQAYVDSRRKEILTKLVADPSLNVDKLAAFFSVSPVTIRRDLQFLEDQKLLVRSYGKAVPTEKTKQAIGMSDVSLYRSLIAKYAATLIEDDDSIFINTSRNALEVIKYITKNNITVITNNGYAMFEEHQDNVNVYLTGGELRNQKAALVGEFAERNLLKVYAKKAFIGCSGISVDCGVTTENANEVNLNELMLRRTTKDAYILADSTKLGKNSSFRTCGIDKVTHLITDENAAPEIIESFRKKGIQVHLVRRSDFFNA